MAEWPKFVNAYEVHQHRGGSEEGGWWYDAGYPLASIPVFDEEDERRSVKKLEKMFDFHDQESWDRRRRRGRTSCAGGYDIEVRVESHFAVNYPSIRPRYE